MMSLQTIMIRSTIDKLCSYRLPVIRYHSKQSEDDFVIDHCVKKCIYAYGKHDLNMM